MHDQTIRQLYHCMLHENGEADKISRETREAVSQILKDNDCLDNEKLHDAFFLATSAAEENGFVKGFISAFHLLSECTMNNR